MFVELFFFRKFVIKNGFINELYVGLKVVGVVEIVGKGLFFLCMVFVNFL